MEPRISLQVKYEDVLDEWIVTQDHKATPLVRFRKKEDALDKAMEYARRNEPATVQVYAVDGQLEEEFLEGRERGTAPE